MYPSLMRFPGSLFADFGELQRKVEQLLNARACPSSIRAVGSERLVRSFAQKQDENTARSIDSRRARCVRRG